MHVVVVVVLVVVVIVQKAGVLTVHISALLIAYTSLVQTDIVKLHVAAY